MKVSEINAAIDNAKKVMKEANFHLPSFSTWSPEDWKANKEAAAEIIATGMGWDVTDYGQGRFHELGATLFTIRNGLLEDPSIGVPYAEKIMVMTEGQTIPMHFHYTKQEDIINRGTGVLRVVLNCSGEDGSMDLETPPRAKCDGVWKTFEPGVPFDIQAGDSITIQPRMYHKFWAAQGHGTLLAGEVSSVNDDNSDNCFYEMLVRYMETEEDEPVRYILCNEYAKYI